MLQKMPSLKWTQHLWDFCGSLIKTLQGWSFPCGGFPAISQRRMVDWTWPWNKKALHMWWVALLTL